MYAPTFQARMLQPDHQVLGMPCHRPLQTKMNHLSEMFGRSYAPTLSLAADQQFRNQQKPLIADSTERISFNLRRRMGDQGTRGVYAYESTLNIEPGLT